MINKFQWLFLLSVVLVSCNNDDVVSAITPVEEQPVVAGSANFSKYVALGDSFAAGYGNGALFIKGQENAYPSILAQQFMAAGGGSFKVPLMNDNAGGLLLKGDQIANVRLYFNNVAPVLVSATATTEVTKKIVGPFNNLGVPGAKSFHLIASGYGNVEGVASGVANPYYARFATSSTSTVLADALAQSPTFFSLWVGGNDVLGYAVSGGVGVDQKGNADPATYGTNDITDPTVFATVYTSLVTNLTAGGAKGVVANLPAITAMPYFTTVPYNPIPLDAATITLLMDVTTGYGKYNGGIQYALANKLISADEAARRTISFRAGAGNAVVIEDSYLTNLSAYGIPSYRQATSEDLLVLTSSSVVGKAIGGDATKVNGVSVPLEDKWVLSKDEVAEIKAATDAFNVKIKAMADAKGLAFVDTNVILNNLTSATGLQSNGFTLTSAFVTGGAFSLDGIHLTARGYAYVSNAFIDAINLKFGSTLKKVNIGLYPLFYPETIK